MPTGKHPDAGRVFLPFGPSPTSPALRVLDDGNIAIESARRMRDGEPMIPGQTYAMPTPDGHYRVIELGGHGPAQVATEAYRDGWMRTFDKSLN